MQNTTSNPRVLLVSGPVIVRNNKVNDEVREDALGYEILLDISSDDSFWKFCGGKVKKNESLQETTIRRAKEELGINITIINEMPFLIYSSKKINNKKVEILLAHYLSKYTGEITPGKDVKKWAWIPIKDLKNKKIAPNILPTLKYFNLYE